eukprot:g7546.t1
MLGSELASKGKASFLASTGPGFFTRAIMRALPLATDCGDQILVCPPEVFYPLPNTHRELPPEEIAKCRRMTQQRGFLSFLANSRRKYEEAIKGARPEEATLFLAFEEEEEPEEAEEPEKAPMDDCEPLEGAPEQEDRQQKRGIVNDPEQKS